MTDPTDIAAMECSIDQLAALAGVSSRHVRRLLGDTPQTRRGRWALSPAFAALLDGIAGGPAGGDLTKERTGLVRAQRLKLELEYALAKKAVAPLEEIGRAWTMQAAIVRTNILNVPQRVVLQLLGCTDETEFKAKLRAELVLALQQARDTEISEADLTEELGDDADGSEEPTE